GLEIDRDDVELRVLLGQVLERKGDRDSILKSELVWRELRKTKDIRAPYGLARALERKGLLYDEASRAIRSGKRFTEARDPEARSNELQAEAEGYWTESQELYELSYETDPFDRNVVNGLQRVTALRGEHEASLAWTDRLLTLIDGELSERRDMLARPDLTIRAEDLLRTSERQLRELQIETHLHAASVSAAIERYEEAIAHLQLVAELDPTLAEAHSRQAFLFERLGQHEAAIHEIDVFMRKVDLGYDHPTMNEAFALRRRNEDALRR
ncbi:MAG: hypothetical protein AAF368_17875, partial [Planctomycetota bacterium]